MGTTFGSLLSASRAALHLTPQAFACLLGVTPDILHWWETGITIPGPAERALVLDTIEVAVHRQPDNDASA